LFEGHATADDSRQTLSSDRVAFLVAELTRYKLFEPLWLVLKPCKGFASGSIAYVMETTCTRLGPSSLFVESTRSKRYLRPLGSVFELRKRLAESFVFESLGSVLKSRNTYAPSSIFNRLVLF
jgi:hypothetical protein